MRGPSKYDELAADMIQVLCADAVVVVVVGGVVGSGACPAVRMSGEPKRDRALVAGLALALRELATRLEADAVDLVQHAGQRPS